MRSLQNPPSGVKLVMEAACIMFDEKPKMKDDPNKMGEHWTKLQSEARMHTSDPVTFVTAVTPLAPVQLHRRLLQQLARPHTCTVR